MKYENEGRIVVVGAGIAGLTAASSLADMGRSVMVVDPKTDPTAPISMDIRHTIPSVRPSLGLPLGNSPLVYASIEGVNEEGGLVISDPSLGVHCIDALSARRTLLKRASDNPRIELIAGKVIDLSTSEYANGERVTGVRVKSTLEDKSTTERLIETGEDGLVIMAAGRGTTVFSKYINSKHTHHPAMAVLGAYITSPALREEQRNTARSGPLNDFYGVIIPAESVEDNGTDFAIYFVSPGAIPKSSRGGSKNVLATMRQISEGSKWEELLKEAKADRVLYYSHRSEEVRTPKREGLVLVGDSSKYLIPGTHRLEGFGRIDSDVKLLLTGVELARGDLSKAAEIYNKGKSGEGKVTIELF